MKITALEEYGLRCMILLAKRGPGESLTLPELAKLERLSLPYAGKLLMILRKGKLVSASRGRSGGYLLSKSPDSITIKEIFQALGDGIYTPNHCTKFTGEMDACVHTDDCSVRSIWKSFDNFFGAFLEKISLSDVASNKVEIFNPNVLELRKK
jgi:Rrf2 family iron-sulfur cluster assembly transcriptional regulator